MSDDRLPRDTLHRYRLRLLGPRGSVAGDLRKADRLAAFVLREVVPAHGRSEHFGAVFLDRDRRPMAYTVAHVGDLGRRRIAARTIIGPGLLIGAAGMVLFHYRFQPELKLRRRDVRIARRLRNAGEVAGVRLLDHLLLHDGEGWLSLRREERLELWDLGERVRGPHRDGRAWVRPKYRNPDNPEETWSGRGHMARWLRQKVAAGARLEDFLIREGEGREE